MERVPAGRGSGVNTVRRGDVETKKIPLLLEGVAEGRGK